MRTNYYIITFLFFVNLVISCSQKKEDIIHEDEALLRKYNQLAEESLEKDNILLMGLYLDSAKIFIDLNVSKRESAFYYLLVGDYYRQSNNEQLSTDYYYRSLALFEETDVNIFNPLYKLSLFYTYRQDIKELNNLKNNMFRILNKYPDIFNDVLSFRTARDYYKILYNENKKEIHLDSTLYYSRKIIDILENPQESIFIDGIDYDYISLAGILMDIKPFNADSIRFLIAKSENRNLKDTTAILNTLMVKRKLHRLLNERETERELDMQQLDILTQWSDKLQANVFLTKLYNTLAEWSAGEGDYKEAYKYAIEKQGVDAELYNQNLTSMREDLREKYESNQKEVALMQEKEKSRMKGELSIALGVILLLLILLVLLALSRMRIKRKQSRQEREHVRLELENLKSKYDVQSQKLEEVLDETKILSKERQDVLLLLEDKRRTFCLPIRDVYGMICKRLSESEDFAKYKSRLYTLTNDFIEYLSEDKYKLSINELNYCILFTILMLEDDIARCLGVKKITISRRKSEIKQKYFALEEERISLESILNNILEKVKEDKKAKAAKK